MGQSGREGFLDQGPLPLQKGAWCQYPIPASFPFLNIQAPVLPRGSWRVSRQVPGVYTHTLGVGAEGHLRTVRHVRTESYLFYIPGLNKEQSE